MNALMISYWWLMPLLSGLLLSCVTGPLGSFVVWRRMAFFGDTLAHGALLGITLGVISDINPTLALLLSSVILALLLYPMQRIASLSSDTLLGIISHSMLAVGLVVLSLAHDVRVDLMGYLFGDLLAVTSTDTLMVAIAAVICIGLIIWQWRGLLATTVSPELAAIDGYPVARLQLLLILMLALVIALAMKIVGILLVSAMLIIPPAAARSLSRTPEQMALFASLIGLVSVLMGMSASFWWDTPAGPSVVVAATLLFVASTAVNRR
ncbi:zinc ABC transporter permease subunit ZnuB [Oceanobacter sp. 3_MG-2023]|uniref:zinc ABC transporter permease subunit ZnuB n=1 Tax=Oceanobacter sp. 3_MG-2023 TaxID=3062622 RepID=UPI0027342D95|nr:zinc ABC transporter permease subunit ZnuB [Oceanobacter sp. 3_MG-2023]MDP2504666.1 zinc ABC transporter permease subunit ZnuB [Oceanobacter sp. 3_MG-2023]